MSRVMSLSDGLVERKVIDITEMPSLRNLEKDYFFAVLNSVDGSKAEAAKILGITVKSVYNKINAYKKTEGAVGGETTSLDVGNVVP